MEKAKTKVKGDKQMSHDDSVDIGILKEMKISELTKVAKLCHKRTLDKVTIIIICLHPMIFMFLPHRLENFHFEPEIPFPAKSAHQRIMRNISHFLRLRRLI